MCLLCHISYFPVSNSSFYCFAIVQVSVIIGMVRKISRDELTEDLKWGKFDKHIIIGVLFNGDNGAINWL